MKKLFFVALAASALLTSCTYNPILDDVTTPQKPADTAVVVTGIPSDTDATDPVAIVPNVTLPAASYSGVIIDGEYVIRVDLSGISQKDGKGWLTLLGTNEKDQNIWITVDSVNKGIQVLSVSDSQSKAKVDLTFLIDNSGSMSEEADTIASSVVDWANQLDSSGLDIQFACVGYDGAITGANDLSSVKALKFYLDRSTGTSRTVGFTSSCSLDRSDISKYTTGGGSSDECGVAALRFANDKMSFRAGATRLYVNFTDEPNQPNSKSDYSVEYLNPINKNWLAEDGTVHSVYSASDTSFTEQVDSREYPWKMAEYTGGTKKFTNSSFQGVSLSDLPVTGALTHSHIIYFTNIKALFDKQTHKVVITVCSKDRTIQGTITLYVNFSNLKFTEQK